MSRPRIPVIIRGVSYVSYTRAAKVMGVTVSTITQAKKRGTLDRVGLNRVSKKKAKSAPIKRRATLTFVSGRAAQTVTRRPGKAQSPIACIFHPHWCPALDHKILISKASGDNFSIIADRLGRERVAVEQRWHRLRVVPNIARKLKAYGLTDAPYPIGGGQDG